jgi:hypothetical protein
LSSLSAPRITIVSASSGSGRCNALASSTKPLWRFGGAAASGGRIELFL